MLNRRTLIGATAAAASLGVLPALAQPLIVTSDTVLMPRSGSAPRIVIAGGGWGGLTAARHLREQVPEAEVIVVERNPFFWSCPISNKWLAGLVDSSFLMHDTLALSKRHGYGFVRADITGIDRGTKRIRTSLGSIDYDFLVVAGGIRDAWERWFGEDRQAAEYTRRAYGSAYVTGGEHISVKQRIQNFQGGTFVMTLPPPPHRCPPSPYERACMAAWTFKTRGIPAKIVILDPKPNIMPIGAGFRYAFEELYPDIITHVPNAGIRSVDPFNRRISTEAGDFDFDDGILMPPHHAADLVWEAGLIDANAEGPARNWAAIHPTLIHARDDEDTYVIGDAMGAVSPQFGFYPKSAHVANAFGGIVATYLAQRIRGEEVKVVLPDNLCYMMVNGDPQEAIAVQFDYEIGPEGIIRQTQIDVDIRSPDLVEENFRWAARMYGDFLV